MPVVVDDLPDAKPIGKVTDSYILYMVEKAKRKRHEKLKIHDQLNPPPDIQKHPDDLQKRKLSSGLPSRSPTSTLPILKSTTSPTNKMSVAKSRAAGRLPPQNQRPAPQYDPRQN